MLTKDTLFRATKPGTKADSISRIAMGIVEAETAARQAKTARLQAARAERDASEEVAQDVAPIQKKPLKKASAKAKNTR